MMDGPGLFSLDVFDESFVVMTYYLMMIKIVPYLLMIGFRPTNKKLRSTDTVGGPQ